jgi:phosphatidylglycerophosphate synthase
MVLHKYRKLGDRILTPLAIRLKGVNPNILTILSFPASVVSGFFFYMGDYFLIFASLFILISFILDVLDGHVARLAGKISKAGDFLDHGIDRYSDVAVLLGITFSSYCRILIGCLAIIAVLLTSYMGTLAQSVSTRREYGGILGRADRYFFLITMPLIQYVFSLCDNGKLYGLWIAEITMIFFAVGCTCTSLYRFIKVWRMLRIEELN